MGAGANDDLLLLNRRLLDAFRAGEREALARVFRHYVDDVTMTLRRGVVVQVDGGPVRAGRGLPEGEVESLIQETFLKAFAPAARERYDGLRPFGAWLATIARNVLIDYARRAKKSGVVLAPDEVERMAVDDGSKTAADHFEERELSGLVSQIVAQLGEPDRSIYRARYEEERSLKETAEALSIPLITIRRRDAQIRQRILEELRGRGYLRHARVRLPAGV